MTNNIRENLIQLLLKEDVKSFNALREKETTTKIDLSETDLEGLTLNNANFSEFELNGVNFADSSLENAIFTNTNLTTTNFTGADLKYCNFNNANLSGAYLTNTDATEADFTDANFNGTDLRETNFTNAELSASVNLSQAKFDNLTIWPENQNLPEDFDSSCSNLSNNNDEDENVYDGEIENN